MDMEALIAEILRRVEIAMATSGPLEIKPKLLVLSRSAGENGCQSIVNDQAIAEAYDVDVIDDNYDQVNLDRYRKVVIGDLDNTTLSKLVLGIFDDPYLKCINDCILKGKNIAVCESGVEFLQFAATAPVAFVSGFNAKLDTLKSWGITVEAADGIARVESEEKTACACNCQSAVNAAGKTIAITKRVLTEVDMFKARKDGATAVKIAENALVTDVAKEYAHKQNIAIIR
mgnify:CR=1 FL=1